MERPQRSGVRLADEAEEVLPPAWHDQSDELGVVAQNLVSVYYTLDLLLA